MYDSLGKLGIEMSNIGLGIGTCVAFYIIIGDLLPPLVAQSLGLTMVREGGMHVVAINVDCNKCGQ